MAIDQVQMIKQMKHELTRFMMMYKFALYEIETKVDILQEEFQMLHSYNPIEHTNSRLKTFESIIEKLYRKKCEFSMESIRANIKDIAGLRITCSFISDIYRIQDMLANQSDLNILEVKDYIQNPKPNGYKSLHLIVEVPVFMSDRSENISVEVQIRTIAMDFWASLEHKIYYKYKKDVPVRLLRELKEAADTASALDQKMELLHKEVDEMKDGEEHGVMEELLSAVLNNQGGNVSPKILQLLEGNGN